MSVPVLQAHGSRRLDLTKAGAGGVLLADLMLVSGEVTSWAVTLASGTSGIWSLPTDGTHPTPVSGSPPAGTWTFNVVATNGDGPSSPAVLTITVPASPSGYTVATRSQLVAITAGGDSSASKLNGYQVELAQASTDFGTATSASPIRFARWRCSGSNRCVVQHEDPESPCDLGSIDIRLCRNIDFVSLRINQAERIATNTEKAWYFRNTTPSADAPNMEGVRCLATYGPWGVDGSGDPTKGLLGLYLDGSAADMELEFEDCSFYWIRAGITTITTTTVNQFNFTGRTLIRYYTGNAMKLNNSGEGSFIQMDEYFVMSPMTDITEIGTHADDIQVSNGNAVRDFRVRVLLYAQADGVHSAQTFFSRPTGAGVNALLNVEIGTYVSLGRSVHAMSLDGSDATHVIDIGQATLMRQISGPWGIAVYEPDGTTITNQTPPQHFPDVRLGAATTPAYTTLRNLWVHSTVASNPNGVSLAGNIIQYADDPDVSAHFPGASWIASDALEALVVANTGVENYQGVDDARWHGSDDEVLALIAAALSPVVGGPLENGDGTFVGAYFPDGSFNDGSVFVPATPTQYEIAAVSASPPSQVLTVTATLNQPAQAPVTITLDATGVAGTWDPSDTVLIGVGELSGSRTYTPSGSGTLTISATNDSDLTDPDPIVVDIAPAPPTTVQQFSSQEGVFVGRSVTFSYLLDKPATQDVTITPGQTGLTGSFSAATVVIVVGESSGSVDFTATSVGTGLFTATNDRGLAGPDPFSLASYAGGATKGALLRYGIGRS